MNTLHKGDSIFAYNNNNNNNNNLGVIESRMRRAGNVTRMEKSRGAERILMRR
jgi:hypothetical protein